MVVEQIEVGTGRTGGRDATTGVIPGRFALSVGMPESTPPKGWKWTPLSSVAQLESGHTPSRKHPEYWDGGIPWIGIKDATENHGRTIQDTYQHVSELGLENSSARLLPANTVCLSRTASVGFVVVMGRPMATSQDFVNWVCGPNIDPHFLKYVLLAENEALWRFASGTTHQTIYYPEAKAFHVCLPPLAEQKAIAAVLGALDDKIELNRRMNATLEAMARALFQSWFVDFDPVRAKLDGRQPTGLDKGTAALFPESFQDSALGQIPKGWNVTTLGACIGFRSGFSFKSQDWQESGVPVVKIGSVKPGIIDLTQVSYVSEEIAHQAARYRLRPGDMLIGMTGYVGEVGLVPPSDNPPLLNQRVGKFVMQKPGTESLAFWYCTTRQGEFRAFVEARSHGTAQANVSGEAIMEFPLIAPSPEVLDAFNRECQPMLDRILSNHAQSRTLATLRDTLLPKFLSGEMRASGLNEKVAV
jgi:type I restriction enzyme S subunit